MTGSGTEANPYIIHDVDDLQAVKDHLDAYYELANNIDASATSDWNDGAGFIPIGVRYNGFTGHFDGKGYTISDLFINRPTSGEIGLFGETEGAIVQNVDLVDADITGDDDVGGLIGHADDTTITDCSASGVFEGDNLVGGLVGWFDNSIMSRCHSSGTVTSTGAGSADLGGLTGYASGEISYCYSTATVNAIRNNVGGLIGYVGENVVINRCFATGNVTASTRVGGLIGYTSGATVSNCYATGKVTSSTPDEAGGLICSVLGVSDIIDNCYSTGEVIGEYTGGLIYSNSGTVTNCFWDKQTSGLDTSDGGTGKTTAEMKTKSTFTDADWDFETIWNICSSVNADYPCLVGVTPSCAYVTARHHPTIPTEPNRGKLLSKMGSL